MPFHRVLWHSVGFHVIPHRILRNSTMFYCILQGSMAFCAGFYGLSQDSGGFYGIPPGDIGDIRTSHCNEQLRGHWGHKNISLYSTGDLCSYGCSDVPWFLWMFRCPVAGMFRYPVAGTPEHLIVLHGNRSYNEMFRCPVAGTPEHLIVLTREPGRTNISL